MIICSDCKGIIRPPGIICTNCDKQFCKTCAMKQGIDQWKRIECPVCKKDSKITNQIEIFKTEFIYNLQFQCKKVGCNMANTRFSYQEYYKHLAQKCYSIKKTCPCGCNRVGDREVMKNHVVIIKCKRCYNIYNKCVDANLESFKLDHGCSTTYFKELLNTKIKTIVTKNQTLVQENKNHITQNQNLAQENQNLKVDQDQLKNQLQLNEQMNGLEQSSLETQPQDKMLGKRDHTYVINNESESANFSFD